VLAGKDIVEQSQTKPEPGLIHGMIVRVWIHRDQTIRAGGELSVLPRPHSGLNRGGAAVDLRAVPPVTFDGAVRGRYPRLIGRAGRVRGGSHDLHRLLRPWIVIREGHLPRVVRRALSMAEPVTNHELE